MSHPDDDIARDLRRELQGSLVPYDPGLAQHMIDEAITASSGRGLRHSRWTMPILASGAVAAVVGGVAGATALHPSASRPQLPRGTPASVRPTLPTTNPPSCIPLRPGDQKLVEVGTTVCLIVLSPEKCPVTVTISPSGPLSPPRITSTEVDLGAPCVLAGTRPAGPPPTATTVPPLKVPPRTVPSDTVAPSPPPTVSSSTGGP
jgi:hypothetical protein